MIPAFNGKFCMVSVDLLEVDHSYQRPRRSIASIRKITESFSWKSFGAIVVLRRSDGRYYITDGQQRVEAAKLLGISEVPCLVFESTGQKDEADSFLGVNTVRGAVQSVYKFRSAVMSQKSPEKDISDWLATHGLCIAAANSESTIGFAEQMILTWSANTECCKRAIIVQRKINGVGQQLQVNCHLGLFWLLKKGVNVEEFVDKLREMGGKPAMVQAIKEFEIETGKKANENVAGRGILRLINYKRRNKIVIRGEENTK